MTASIVVSENNSNRVIHTNAASASGVATSAAYRRHEATRPVLVLATTFVLCVVQMTVYSRDAGHVAANPYVGPLDLIAR